MTSDLQRSTTRFLTGQSRYLANQQAPGASLAPLCPALPTSLRMRGGPLSCHHITCLRHLAAFTSFRSVASGISGVHICRC